MAIKAQPQFVVYTIKVPRIKRSTIKEFLIVDVIIGTGLYYAFKLYTSSEVIGLIGSIVGVTGIRQTTSIIKKTRAKTT